MAHKSIGYHTRSYLDTTKKLTGGSFGGEHDAETIQRLARNLFTCRVTPSGSVVFVDREGRDVWLYVTVDAAKTDMGREALAADRKQREEADRQAQDTRAQLLDTLDGMTNDELADLLARRLEG